MLLSLEFSLPRAPLTCQSLRPHPALHHNMGSHTHTRTQACAVFTVTHHWPLRLPPTFFLPPTHLSRTLSPWLSQYSKSGPCGLGPAHPPSDPGSPREPEHVGKPRDQEERAELGAASLDMNWRSPLGPWLLVLLRDGTAVPEPSLRPGAGTGREPACSLPRAASVLVPGRFAALHLDGDRLPLHSRSL